MSLELEDAKKKVAEFQKQCEEYLVVIVQQKREADEQQKVGGSTMGPPLMPASYQHPLVPISHCLRGDTFHSPNFL